MLEWSKKGVYQIASLGAPPLTMKILTYQRGPSSFTGGVYPPGPEAAYTASFGSLEAARAATIREAQKLLEAWAATLGGGITWSDLPTPTLPISKGEPEKPQTRRRGRKPKLNPQTSHSSIGLWETGAAK